MQNLDKQNSEIKLKSLLSCYHNWCRLEIWEVTTMMVEVQLQRQSDSWENERNLLKDKKKNWKTFSRQCTKILLLTKSFMPILCDFQDSYFC